jgi:hypothetical protein
MIYLDNIKDERIECYSVLAKIKTTEYLTLIQGAYYNRGGIKGQRAPLKTKSAQRIRKRLVEDIQRNSVIPPIVLGVRIQPEEFAELNISNSETLTTFFDRVDKPNLSIIDGMQRTTALIEAMESGKISEDHSIRIELWISQSSNSLIYRMLVLNSGQIPWNLKRQLNVVFSQFTSELKDNIRGLQLIDTDDETRRSSSGMYQASDFIELFMLFGTRKVSLDLQAELAEEFTRLDLAETSGNKSFMNYFIEISSLMVKLDEKFTSLTTNPTEIELKKYKTGFSIFSSQPARAAFIAACSQEIFGLLGTQLSQEEQESRFNTLSHLLTAFIDTIPVARQDELFNFIDLPTLDERANLKSNKIGEYERNLFLSSFKTLISLLKEGELRNMTPCWSNYQ